MLLYILHCEMRAAGERCVAWGAKGGEKHGDVVAGECRLASALGFDRIP